MANVRILLRWQLPLAAALCALPPAVAGEKPAFVGVRLLQNTFAPSVAPATGDTKDGKISRLARVSERRYLALVEESYFQIDPWADPKQMEKERRASGVVSAPFRRLQATLSLAVLDPTGRILKRSVGGPELSTAVSPYPNSHHLPLVLDPSERCPYAILHASSRSLICFDHELGFVEKFDVPLDEIGAPRIALAGGSASIVFFGRQYSQRRSAATFSEVYDATPEAPVGLGARLDLEEGAWRPLAVDPAQLASDLSRRARSPQGEKVPLLPATLQLIPFRGGSPGSEFGVLIEAASSERFDSALRFEGTRYFFRSRLGSEGLGTVEPLPFWIVQEERTNVEVRKVDGGIAVYLPAFAKFADLQVFERGDRSFAVALHLAYKAPEADGSYHPSRWSALQLIVLFTGTQLDSLLRMDDEELLEAATKPLSQGDRWVALVKLVDFLGKDEFAFWAFCGHRQRPKENQRCVAIARLRE